MFSDMTIGLTVILSLPLTTERVIAHQKQSMFGPILSTDAVSHSKNKNCINSQ